MSAPTRRRLSLAGRLAAVLLLVVLSAAAGGVGFVVLFNDPLLAILATVAVLLPPVLWLARRSLRSALSLFRALEGTVTSYRDGDYGFSLAWPRNDELGDLVAAHNALGDTLREQRVGLVQRELLLDTMVQNTPVAMLLLEAGGRAVFANLAARRLLNEGRRLEGLSLDDLLEGAPASLHEAMGRGGDGLFSVGEDEAEETYHLARRRFLLNGRHHELILLRHLTTELRRQEVRTWKKVIRVMSHELNNSLAPIASLAHSGAELVRRGRSERLEEVFATIEGRARHLESFILGYARFAKLPHPQVAEVPWPSLVEHLQAQVGFVLQGELPAEPARVDPAQFEQVLLNLLKNAHESGSPPGEVALAVRRLHRQVRVEVLDRGTGMSEAVLANALVPFYSTKRSGTGLGLALSREIIEAHGGRIALSNRKGGGLCVALTLPA